jgi:hypothetical protein
VCAAHEPCCAPAPTRRYCVHRNQHRKELRCSRYSPARSQPRRAERTDAFAGALTRGSIGTIPETAETENSRSYQGGLWLRDLDSSQV